MNINLRSKTFSLIVIIIAAVSALLYFCSLIELNDLLSIAVLSVTAWIIGMQSSATEKMAEYQILPAIDVNMVYDPQHKKTYFWFANYSDVAGFVHLKHRKNGGKKSEIYHPLRINPREPGKKTATTFDFSQKEGDELKLYVTITPSINKSRTRFRFEKSYRFSDNRWNETSWSYPDPPLPM